MKSLLEGCSRSEISVIPSNWDKLKVDDSEKSRRAMKKPWRIYYRFYDPVYRHDKKLWGKLIPIKGMNNLKTLAERQAITRGLIEDELYRLDVRGYNPITKRTMSQGASVSDGEMDLTATTPFLSALRFALKHIEVEPHTREDITSTLKYFGQSATLLKKHSLPLKDIKRRDIIAILDNCKNLTVSFKKRGESFTRPKVWTDNQFNHYRKYLHVLYAYLEKEEVVEYNPIERIDKKIIVVDEDAGRQVLTEEERNKIDVYFRAKPRLHTFLRFLNIFYHSGARPLELTKVQGKHVDLASQKFRVLVKKGSGGWRLKTKTIKDIALPFWKEAMAGCRPNDYVFSVGLKPGAQPILRHQLTHRWERHVKKALGITADLYSLKHLHSTEVRDILEEGQEVIDNAIQAVAEHNSHVDGAMVVQIYDVKNSRRKHNRVKKVANAFAGGNT